MRDYCRRVIVDRDFNQTLYRLTNELREAGMTVLGALNAGERAGSDMDQPRSRYAIVEACDPSVVRAMINEDPALGPFAVYSFAVFEADGRSTVAVADIPAAAYAGHDWRLRQADVATAVARAEERVAQILDRLARSGGTLAA